MSLRLKTLLLLGLTFTLSLIALYLIADFLIERAIANFEDETTHTDVQRVREALTSEKDAFAVLLRDWSVWDDTYAFVQDHDPAFVESNLTENEFTSLALNVMVFLDNEGKIVYATGFDLDQKRFTAIPNGLAALLVPDNPLLSNARPANQRVGFVELPNGIMLLGSHPIQDSLEEQPTAGTLVFGRYFNSAQLAQLAKTTHLNLAFYPWNAKDLPPYLSDARAHLSDSQSAFSLPIDGRTLFGFGRIDDLSDKPVYLAEISIERTTYGIVQSGLRFFLLSLVLIGLVGTGTVMWLAERLVLRPVKELSSQVRLIGDQQDSGARVAIQAQAELASLGKNINAMLTSLEESRRALDTERARYQAIVEGQREWIIRFLPDGALTFVNEAFCRAVGKRAADIMGTPWFDLMPEAVRRDAELSFKEVTSLTPVRSMEMRVPQADGTLTWQSWTWHAIPDPDGHLAEIQGVGNDITERVQAEEQSRYLSSHDALTGLYNRAYFEAEMEQLEQGGAYPISIIVGDIDRFKRINDQYGHTLGDATLRDVATILGQSVRAQDIVARIGGDEFAILLPEADSDTAAETLQRIKQRFLVHNALAESRPVYMSLGHATALHPIALSATLQRADEKMYAAKFAQRAAPLSEPSNDLGGRGATPELTRARHMPDARFQAERLTQDEGLASIRDSREGPQDSGNDAHQIQSFPTNPARIGG